MATYGPMFFFTLLITPQVPTWGFREEQCPTEPTMFEPIGIFNAHIVSQAATSALARGTQFIF